MDQLVLLAAAESEVMSAIGSARREPEVAAAWRSHALARDVADLSDTHAFVAALEQVLHDDVADGEGADDAWQALGVLAAVAAWDAVTPTGMQALGDIDDLLRDAGVAPAGGVVQASHYPDVAWSLPVDIDVRVIPRDAATAVAHAWLDGHPGPDVTGLGRYCRSYLALAEEATQQHRPGPDWWAVTPDVVAADIAYPRVSWPLVALPDAAPHRDLIALAESLLGRAEG